MIIIDTVIFLLLFKRERQVKILDLYRLVRFNQIRCLFVCLFVFCLITVLFENHLFLFIYFLFYFFVDFSLFLIFQYM